MSAILLHPVTLVFAQYAIIIATLGLTPATSPLRPLVLLPLLALAYRILADVLTALPNLPLAGLVAGHAPSNVLLYLDLCLLRRWDHAHRGPTVALDTSSTTAVPSTASPPPSSSPPARLLWAAETVLSPRHVQTPFEAAHTPPWTPHPPSRTAYLRRALLVATACFLVVDALGLANDPTGTRHFFVPSRVPLLARWREVGLDELGVRVASTLALGVTLYSMLCMGHAVLGFVCVGLGVSRVEMWRPPFGPLAGAWSLRRFWGTTWHQFFRDSFSSPAAFLTHRVLRLPAHGPLPRLLKLTLAFLGSGLMHAACDIGLGMPATDTGAPRFFLTQAAGIAFEDVVRAAWRGQAGGGRGGGAGGGGGGDGHGKTANEEKSKGAEQRPRWWLRLLGYVWVVLFLTWSLPAYSYPLVLRSGTGPESRLPFSVLAPLLGKE